MMQMRNPFNGSLPPATPASLSAPTEERCLEGAWFDWSVREFEHEVNQFRDQMEIARALGIEVLLPEESECTAIGDPAE